VLIELKARFDEAVNIRWARRLEQVGIHVTYGVVGLKTHSKIILVVRKDYNGLRRYAHVGTGNYHPGTARLYSDLGMLTCDDGITQDLTEQFNYLTGYSPPPRFRKILTAPYTLKKAMLEKIEREIAAHTPDSPGHIQFKLNALEDEDITRALYLASQAGVKIDLIIRDSCRLRPKVPGLSDNITVISVIGRFLEHSRIYYFRNGGRDGEEYFIGSADLMKRNLESRVEVVAPVEEPKLRQELRVILDAQLSSVKHVWEMQPDGKYLERQDAGSKETRNCQEIFIELAQKRLSAANKHRQSKLRMRLLNHFHRRLQINTGQT
jgi:polyphosphate kinase